MTDTDPFALLILLTAAVGLAAVLSNRLTDRLKIPTPALVLVGAAVAVKVVPALHAPPHLVVERMVTVALVCILFDGGMQIGWSQFRSAAVPVTVTGVAGTFGTVAAGALLAHAAFGLGWYASVLLATAVAPADPAVVFSVLGQREISGRGDTILKGESGANDPVGIALMAGLIGAGGLSASAFGHVGGQFLLQMGVGAAGGTALLWFMRRVPLPGEGLYPLRTLACALLLFAVATLARGSGFLAVFTAGIVLGDGHARTSGRSSGSTRRWPAWPRSSPSPSWASPSAWTRSAVLTSGCRGSSWAPRWPSSSGRSWWGCAWPRPVWAAASGPSCCSRG